MDQVGITSIHLNIEVTYAHTRKGTYRTRENS